MKRMIVLAACLATACGGGGGSKGNAAASRTFSYGTPVTGYTPPGGASSALTGALTASASTSGADAISGPTSLYTAADEALSLAGSSLPVAAASRAQALVMRAQGSALGADLPSGVFDPACATIVPGSATFKGCKFVEQTGGTGPTDPLVTSTFTLDGSVVAAPGSMQWNLAVTFSENSAATTQVQAGSVGISYSSAGQFVVTATTAKAHDDVELHVAFAQGSQSVAAGAAQSADLDVTYVDPSSCATRIVGGTFEAKRVWLTRPLGATAQDLPDLGVKFTWNGCGTGTVQFSQ